MEKCKIIFEQDGKELVIEVTEKDGVISFDPKNELINITAEETQFTKLYYKMFHLFYYLLKIDKKKKDGTVIATKKVIDEKGNGGC